MANNLEQESCWEMVLSSSNDHPEDSGWRGSLNIVYDAKPLSWHLPAEEVYGTVEEASGWGGKPIKAVPISCVPPKEEVLDKKRKRSEFVGKVQKDFTLREVFQSNNLQEIIQNRETAECTLDSQQILQKLKGWTIVTHRRQQNNLGKSRLDKVYRHPASKKLRSVIQVQKFVVESSYIKKAADNAEGGSVQVAVGSQVESLATRPLASDKRADIYPEIFERLKDFFNRGTNPS